MKTKLMLVFILSFAFALRVFNLGNIPAGFTPDEASFGYDAYSILKTGKDQWGHTLPIILESFGDFKMPLYSYLSIPTVAIFGLSKVSIRLTNALVGTLAVLITYLFVSGFAEVVSKKDKTDRGYFQKLALMSSFLLAINPWHIAMSRGAFEANLTTLLIPLSLYFFLKGLADKKYLVFSAFVFGLNLFSYHSARLATPFVALLTVFLFKEELALKKGNIRSALLRYFVPMTVFLIMLLLAFSTLLQGGARRAKDITIFSGALNEASDERFLAVYQGLPQQTARLFHNKFEVIGKRFISNYFQYSSVKFLFFDGPAEGTYGMMPGRGVLYLFELPFLIAFLYSLFSGKNRKLFFLVLFWLLIAPIPAALTTGKGYAANRAETMLPALAVASAMGALALNTFLKQNINIRLLRLSLTLYLMIVIFSLFSFIENYFVLSPYKNSSAMLYGNLEIAGWLSKNTAEKKEIIVSRSLSEPHIYIAYANSWDPDDYQKESANWIIYKEKGLSFLDQLGEYKLGKYTFTNIEYKNYLSKKDILLVGRPGEFPPETRPLVKFLNPDGTVAVMVVEPFNQAYAQAQDAQKNN